MSFFSMKFPFVTQATETAAVETMNFDLFRFHLANQTKNTYCETKSFLSYLALLNEGLEIDTHSRITNFISEVFALVEV